MLSILLHICSPSNHFFLPYLHSLYLLQSLLHLLREKTIRSKDTTVACILDFDFTYTYQLLELALADANLIKQYNLQAAHDLYAAEPSSLQEVRRSTLLGPQQPR